MLSLVTPHWRLDHVLELDADRLRALGIDALLLDVDGTLKDHGAPGFSAEVIAWAKLLRGGGIGLCLLSNGRSPRIGALARRLDVPFVARAFKPLPFGCRSAIGRLGLDRRRVALVGDQVFADVMAGRLAGVSTILVRPTSPVEPWFTRIKRPLERRVLRRLDAAAAAAPTA
jgi:HAD superfamily phosphatase (TIGR01668 family)